MSGTSNIKAIFIYSLMAFFLCFEMALQVSPGVMTQELREALSVDAFGLGLMSSIYFYTYTGMQIPSGLMYDRANFRTLVCVAVLTCSVGATLFAWSGSLLTGSLSRAFMGFGSAFAFLSVLTVADRFFAPKYFAMLAGIAQLLAALGGMAGALPIRWLVEAYGWRMAVMGFAVVGYLLMLVIWCSLVKPEEKRRTLDVQETPTTSLKKIIGNGQTWMLGAYVFFNWAPVTAFTSLWGVPFLITVHGFSPSEAAFLCSLMWLGIGLSSPIVGITSDAIGRRNLLLVLTCLIGAGAITSVVLLPHISLMLGAILMFLAGTGSSGQILTFAVLKDFTSPVRVSTAIGVNNMAMVASGIVMQPLFGFFIAKWSTSSEGLPDASVFRWIMLMVPFCYLACIALVRFGIRETHCASINQ